YWHRRPVHGRRHPLVRSALAYQRLALDSGGPSIRGGYRHRVLVRGPSVPDIRHPLRGVAAAWGAAVGECHGVRYRCVRIGGWRYRADSARAGAPVAAQPPRAARRGIHLHHRHREGVLMEIVVAFAIAVMATSGVWLLLRPRTFQVIIGLSLLSYAVNLFIFSMGRLRV